MIMCSIYGKYVIKSVVVERIADLGLAGWEKNPDLGPWIRDGKIRIRDKHPDSLKLVLVPSVLWIRIRIILVTWIRIMILIRIK
jgi:hypothetical protein